VVGLSAEDHRDAGSAAFEQVDGVVSAAIQEAELVHHGQAGPLALAAGRPVAEVGQHNSEDGLDVAPVGQGWQADHAEVAVAEGPLAVK
jgi:hypothetical protein